MDQIQVLYMSWWAVGRLLVGKNVLKSKITITTIALLSACFIPISSITSIAHAESAPTPPTSFQDLPQNISGIAYGAWQKGSLQVNNSQPHLGAVKVLVGPNTVEDDSDTMAPLFKASQLFAHFTQPKNVFVIKFNRTDIDWAQQQYNSLLPQNRQPQEASNLCVNQNSGSNDPLGCNGSDAQITSNGDAVLIIGQGMKYNGQLTSRAVDGQSISWDYVRAIAALNAPCKANAGCYGNLPGWLIDGVSAWGGLISNYSPNFNDYKSKREDGFYYQFQNIDQFTSDWINTYLNPNPVFADNVDNWAYWNQYSNINSEIFDEMAIEILVNIMGVDSLMKLYSDVGSGQSFNQAFAQEFGLSWADACPHIAKAIADEIFAWSANNKAQQAAQASQNSQNNQGSGLNQLGQSDNSGQSNQNNDPNLDPVTGKAILPVDVAPYTTPIKLSANALGAFNALYQNQKNISVQAWKNVKTLMNVSSVTLPPIQKFIGSHTKPTINTTTADLKQIYKLSSNRSFIKKINIIYYNKTDVSWAEKQVRAIMSANEIAKLFAYKGMPSNAPLIYCWDGDPNGCESSDAWVAADGTAFLFIGVRNTPPPQSDAGFKGELNELFHSLWLSGFVKNNSLLAFPPQTNGQNIQQSNLMPYWFISGGEDFAGVIATFNKNPQDLHNDLVDQSSNLVPLINQNDGKIATYFGNKLTVDWLNKFLNINNASSHWRDIDAMNQAGFSLGTRIIEMMVAIKGPSVLFDIPNAMSQGMSFDQAFETLFGVSWENASPIMAKILFNEISKGN
jgi:hypothetical protein